MKTDGMKERKESIFICQENWQSFIPDAFSCIPVDDAILVEQRQESIKQ